MSQIANTKPPLSKLTNQIKPYTCLHNSKYGQLLLWEKMWGFAQFDVNLSGSVKGHLLKGKVYSKQ